MANKFAADGDPKTLGEIYAYGFRNAHRLSWDTDGTMFASDIGMNNDRGDQHRPQRRELRLDEARGILGERPVARRRAERAVPASGGHPERSREGRLHLSRRDLRPRRRARR